MLCQPVTLTTALGTDTLGPQPLHEATRLLFITEQENEYSPIAHRLLDLENLHLEEEWISPEHT